MREIALMQFIHLPVIQATLIALRLVMNEKFPPA